MSNIEIFNSGSSEHPKVEKIADSNLITEGMYAVINVLSPKNNMQSDLKVGDVLLIEKLKFAHSNLHTVVLKDHPRNVNEYGNFQSFPYLVDDFYKFFDVISQQEGEKIRDLEIEEITKKIKLQEKNVSDLKSDKTRLQNIALEIYSKRISGGGIPNNIATDDVAALLGSPNAIEQIQMINSRMNMASDLVEIQSQYLTKEVQKLENLLASLMPYTMERFICAVASTSEMQESVNELQDGLLTLKLYSGEYVDVSTICEGKGAAYDVPLTLVQNCLYADIELAYFNHQEAKWLDVNNIDESFWEEVRKNQELVNQIFPTERCVCIMATRQDKIDYKDAFINAEMGVANRTTFLAIRNGENIYVVYSPIGSHLAANNLFPSKDALEKHFLMGYDKQKIDINNLQYSETLSRVEKEVLHYKRFLILLAGLQHRLKLLGDFYPEKESFDIFYPPFQDKYFRFIHDQDGSGLIEGEKKLSLSEYISANKKYLRKGSWILCRTWTVMNRITAPACYRYSWYAGRNNEDRYNQIRQPVDDYVLAQVQEDTKGYFIKVPCVRDRDYFQEKVTNARVAIDEKGYDHGNFGYIVLDSVSPITLKAYIASRESRSFYVKYIELFKTAIQKLEDVKAYYGNNFSYLLEAVSHVKDSIETQPYVIESYVMSAMTFFNGKNPQECSLNYLAYSLSKEQRDELYNRILNIELDPEVQLLALKMGQKGEGYLYTTMPLNQQLNQISAHQWVYRFELKNLMKPKLRGEPEIVNLRDHERNELDLLIFDEKTYGNYYYLSDKGYYSDSYRNDQISLLHTKDFIKYKSKEDLINAFELSKSFIQAFISNSVTYDMAIQLKDIAERNIVEHRLLSFPVAMAHKITSILSISVIGGNEWAIELATRYTADALNANLILEQDNFEKCKFGKASSNFEFKENFLDYFGSKESQPFSFSNSSKRLSYALLEVAPRVYERERRLDQMTKDISFSPFEIKYFVELNPELDVNFGNKAFINEKFDLHTIRLSIKLYKVGSSELVKEQQAIIVGCIEKITSLRKEFLQTVDKFTDQLENKRKYSAIARTVVNSEFIVHRGDLDDYLQHMKKEYSSTDRTVNFEWDSEYEIYKHSDIDLVSLSWNGVN